MGISEWIAVVSVIVALISLAHQQYLTRQQNKSEARAKQYDRTTALLFKAIDNPDLLEGIAGQSDDDQRQRRFRQIWINHVLMFFNQRHLYDSPEWNSILIDVKDFMGMAEMRNHWKLYGRYYDRDFQEFVDHQVYAKKQGSPKTEPPSQSKDQDQASTT